MVLVILINSDTDGFTWIQVSMNSDSNGLASGKLTVCYGKSIFKEVNHYGS